MNEFIGCLMWFFFFGSCILEYGFGIIWVFIGKLVILKVVVLIWEYLEVIVFFVFVFFVVMVVFSVFVLVNEGVVVVIF